ncbi:C40 family peptidase [Edaphobacter albus]|uniref:C40 family peptidase n=1 Tax=Edaphobacter sp. 4G125 TaxID=2763071 RepID=UPI0016456974|nr:NlpC/P60 family protein [Edaphobacter sp. 4G125]QNI37531.1 C40 family peptidase [Edaphobacter sp. 4G125]
MIVDDLIGKPYRLGGRGPDGYDCAGLVVELLCRRNIPIRIPDTTDSRTRNVIAMQTILAARWAGVEKPFRGCLVFLKPDHVGVMVNRRQFIHAAEDIGQVCIEYLDSGVWRPRFDGFYEYVGAR